MIITLSALSIGNLLESKLEEKELIVAVAINTQKSKQD
jgi:hypothetical protein